MSTKKKAPKKLKFNVTDGSAAPASISPVKAITTKLAKEMEIGESMKIVGSVRSKGFIQTQFGPQIKFFGSFLAEIGGKKYASKRMYLPSNASEILEDADVSRGEAEFAFILKKVESDKTKQGYTWSVETPLTPAISESPVLRLLEKCQ